MTRITLSLLLLASSLFAQQTITPANVIFSAEAVTALQSWFLTQILSTPTTLASPMTAGQLTFTVVSATGLVQSQEFYIDGEAMNPSDVTGNVVTVTRADLGTTATAHPAGATVSILKYKSLKNFCKQVIQERVFYLMRNETTYSTLTTEAAKQVTSKAVIDAAATAAIQ